MYQWPCIRCHSILPSYFRPSLFWSSFAFTIFFGSLISENIAYARPIAYGRCVARAWALDIIGFVIVFRYILFVIFYYILFSICLSAYILRSIFLSKASSMSVDLCVIVHASQLCVITLCISFIFIIRFIERYLDVPCTFLDLNMDNSA